METIKNINFKAQLLAENRVDELEDKLQEFGINSEKLLKKLRNGENLTTEELVNLKKAGEKIREIEEANKKLKH